MQSFLQGFLQFPDTALEILYFPERASISRPWERLLLGKGPHHITHRFRQSPMSRMLEKLHPVHHLLHRFWLTIKGIHPRNLVLGPLTQSGNGMGMHVWELREGLGNQGEYPVGPLAEGLPTALHRRLKVQLMGQIRR